MRTTRHLAHLIIRDLGKISGLTFEHPDRLTRGEAAAVEAWAKTNPEVVKAYSNKNHPEHGATMLFAQVVRHFGVDHPQDAVGPAPWTEGSLRNLDGPLLEATPAEAEARLAWARTQPDYRAAIADKNHPHYADMVRGTRELAERIAAAPAAAAVDSAAGVETARSPDGKAPDAKQAAQDRIDALRRDPALTQVSHPHHKTAVGELYAAYEDAYGTAAGQAHKAAAGQQAPALTPLQRIRAAEGNPAFVDRRNPDHAAIVADVAKAYQEMHPGPASAASATATAVQPLSAPAGPAQ